MEYYKKTWWSRLSKFKDCFILIAFFCIVYFFALYPLLKKPNILSKKERADIEIRIDIERALLKQLADSELDNAVLWLKKYNKDLTKYEAKKIYLNIKSSIQEYEPNTRAMELITPELFLALVLTESSANSNAISSKGALGLTQIMPLHIKTLAHLEINNKDDLLDSEKNIQAGVHILMGYASRTNELYKALAYYNAGINKYQHGIGYASKVKGLAQKITGTKG